MPGRNRDHPFRRPAQRFQRNDRRARQHDLLLIHPAAAGQGDDRACGRSPQSGNLLDPAQSGRTGGGRQFDRGLCRLSGGGAAPGIDRGLRILRLPGSGSGHDPAAAGRYRHTGRTFGAGRPQQCAFLHRQRGGAAGNLGRIPDVRYDLGAYRHHHRRRLPRRNLDPLYPAHR
ncbi:hypothetical protein SDC9_177547 [bioreactor metagenome]|uniref:Uncharacterized protein n=1 Tax=bioreactor metagenome TaxID=1076179 RepID=A0A645GUS5_9ZZZZ